jgi:hypothetical protein
VASAGGALCSGHQGWQAAGLDVTDVNAWVDSNREQQAA